jgi:hypothetical protein
MPLPELSPYSSASFSYFGLRYGSCVGSLTCKPGDRAFLWHMPGSEWGWMSSSRAASFEDRLIDEAKRFKEQAKGLAPGPERVDHKTCA